MGYAWWEYYDKYCYVISVSADGTQVTCRLPFDLGRQAKEYETVVFASTFEEANCEMDNGCMFTFIAADQLPVVTGPAVAVFDQTSLEYQITIPGTGFTDTVDLVEFFLGTEAQTIVDVTST